MASTSSTIWEAVQNNDLLFVQHYGGDVNQKEPLGLRIPAAAHLHQTPLHIAAACGHFEISQILLAKGANVHDTDVDNSTALHLAASSGHVGIIELLIANGANIESTNTYNWTPLHCAIDKKNTVAVKLLILKGANPTGFCESTGNRISDAQAIHNNKFLRGILDQLQDIKNNLTGLNRSPELLTALAPADIVVTSMFPWLFMNTPLPEPARPSTPTLVRS